MKRALWALSVFVLLLPSGASAGERGLLVVSIDGMRPDYVLLADKYGLKIPTLRRLLRDGAHASGVRGVLPTVTYPSHTTLITGVSPARHTIYSNTPFDPLDRNRQGWYWYAESIAAPTLWQAAANAGLTVGSVSWPVSVGAAGVRFNIPELWRSGHVFDDLKLLHAVSSPGLLQRFEKEAGPFALDDDDVPAGDELRTRYASLILEHERVQFMTVHLIALDHVEHESGPLTPEAFAALEKLDGQLATLEEAARAHTPQLTVCVVSDHGFQRTDHLLDLRRAFEDDGLITTDSAHKVVEWLAMPKTDGGSAGILLHDPNDRATLARVDRLLRHLAQDPEKGIDRILAPAEIHALGGQPNAVLWVAMKPGFAIGPVENTLVKTKKTGGTHGYLPTDPEMRAAFLIAGPGIAAGLDLGEIDMRSIAPTLARVMGFELPSAERKPLSLSAH